MDQNYRKTRKTQDRGTRANQPLANDVLNGTIYYVTDEGVLERSNGTIWESYSSSSSSSGLQGPPGMDGIGGEDTEPFILMLNPNNNTSSSSGLTQPQVLKLVSFRG